MDREKLSILIDAYADAKVSRNRYLIELMLKELNSGLDEVFANDVEPLPMVAQGDQF